MIFAGKTNGGFVFIDGCKSLEINQSLDIPADELKAKFVYRDNFPHIGRIYLMEEPVNDVESAVNSGRTIFSGVVDTITVSADLSGSEITVCARSMAALLIDNECQPKGYMNPDTDLMYANYLKPFGLKIAGMKRAKYQGRLRIYKGDSHYRALEKYCANFLDSNPRVDGTGVFHTDCIKSGEIIAFDNSAGTAFSSVTVCEDNYSIISKVYVCTDTDGKYNTVLNNEEAQKTGIVRERFLNANADSGFTLSDGDRLIENGRKKSLRVTLTADSMIINKVGCKCTVNTPMTYGRNFLINEIHYEKNSEKEKTTVKLILSEGE